MTTAYQLTIGLLALATCGAAVGRMWQRDPAASWYVSAAGFAAAIFFLSIENAPWQMIAVGVLTSVAGIILHIEPLPAAHDVRIDFDESTISRRR